MFADRAKVFIKSGKGGDGHTVRKEHDDRQLQYYAERPYVCSGEGGIPVPGEGERHWPVLHRKHAFH